MARQSVQNWSDDDILNLMRHLQKSGFASDLYKTLDKSFDRARSDGNYDEDELGELQDKYVSRYKSIEVIDGIANTISGTAKILLDYRAKEFAILEAGFDLINNTLNEQLSLSSKTITDSLGLVSKIYAGEVKALGSQALKNEMTLMKDMMHFENIFEKASLDWKFQYQDAQWQFYDSITRDGIEFAKNGIMDFARIFGYNLEEGMNPEQVKARMETLEEFNENVKGYGDFAEKLGGTIGSINSMVLKDARTMIQKEMSALHKISEFIMDKMTETFTPLTELVDQVSMSLFELDKRAKQTALSFGYIGNKGQQYTQKILQENANVAAQWGKEFKDLLENQERYLDNSGRSYLFSSQDQDVTFAAARLYGMENSSEMAGLFGDMNIFNTSIEKGADTMREMYDIANQMGVSNKKFVKDLSNNLKLAQKYNFVGGTKAMEKMSLWAQQVRLDLNSAAQFAEKLIGGGIEDTLTTAANLQVLGGNAAIFSDPLGMMYDAGADMETMAHRIEAMVGNFGSLDRKTGETTFSWTDTKMMNEIAKALGMSREEVMNMNREKNKFSVVSRQMANTDLTEEQKRMVSNRAVYDEITGKFMVNTLTHGKQTVDQLTPELLKDILPEDNQEALVEYAKRSLDVETEQLAIARKTSGLAMVGSATAWYDTQQKMLNEMASFQGTMTDLTVQNSGKIWDMQLNAYKAQNQRTEAAVNSGLFDNYVDMFNSNLSETSKSVLALNEDFATMSLALKGNNVALSALIQKYGYILDDPDLVNIGQQYQNTEAWRETRGYDNLLTQTGFDKTWFTPSSGTPMSLPQFYQFYTDYTKTNKINDNIIPSGNVTKVQDGIIEKPMFASIDNADRLYAAKSGGALDKSLELIAGIVSHISNQIKNGIDTNTNLSVNGNLNVQGNNVDVQNIVKSISNDTEATYQLVKLLNSAISKQENLRVKTTRLL